MDENKLLRTPKGVKTVEGLRKSVSDGRKKGTIGEFDISSDLLAALADFIRDPDARNWCALECQMHMYQAFRKD